MCVSDLPVCSPLCHAALKTLQRWEQLLLKRLEIFGGPPSKFISTQLLDESVSSGPALLRHKALFEPTNTPFRYVTRLTRVVQDGVLSVISVVLHSGLAAALPCLSDDSGSIWSNRRRFRKRSYETSSLRNEI